MRVLSFPVHGLALALVVSTCVSACDDGGGGGGSGGSAGASTGGSSGVSAGGSGGASGGTGGGSAGTSAGGSAGGGGTGACSVLSFNTCAPLDACMLANCGAAIEACYGPNYASDDATGSLCEGLWSCSKTCTCLDNNCLINTCYAGATADCQACIPGVSSCLQANCLAESQGCP